MGQKIRLGLPAFRKGYYEYSPHQLYSIITSKDIEITFEHLIIIFSLFEDLLNQVSKILCSSEFDVGKWERMKEFFKEEKTKDILTSTQLKELRLAKETRNCYIHRGNRIDKKWLDAYVDARGKTNHKIGEEMIEAFKDNQLYYQVEEWHSLIVEITNKIKNKVKTS